MIDLENIAAQIKTDKDKMTRANMHTHEGVVGVALEVVREIAGQEYSYVGWISMKALTTEPWPADQRAMANNAFQRVIKEDLN